MNTKPKNVQIIEHIKEWKSFLRIDSYRIRHELYAGGMSEEIRREVLVRQNAVAVLLRDQGRKKVILVEQFRVGALVKGEPWIVELVAGVNDKDERPEEIAEREALEETGLIASNFVHIASCYGSVGGCSELTDIFCADIDSSKAGGIHGVDTEGEDIKTIVMGYDEFFEANRKKEFKAASLIIAANWLELETLRNDL